jgi:hypothetical protein
MAPMRIQCVLAVGLAAVTLGGATGCAGSPEAGQHETATDDDTELASTSATRFVCTNTATNEADLTLTVGATGKRISVELGLDNVVSDRGTLDTTYRPWTANANYVRFTGFPALRADGASDFAFLVEKPMLERKTGYAKMQQRGDDFNQTLYRCEPH